MRYVTLEETVKGALIITAFKGSESGSGHILRMYNVMDVPVGYSLGFCRPVAEAYFTMLGEDRLAKIEQTGSRLGNLTAKPKEIITIEVKFTQ